MGPSRKSIHIINTAVACWGLEFALWHAPSAEKFKEVAMAPMSWYRDAGGALIFIPGS